MNQRARGSAALEWEPRVDERGGPGVVVNKKCLGYNPLHQRSGQQASHARGGVCLSRPRAQCSRENYPLSGGHLSLVFAQFPTLGRMS